MTETTGDDVFNAESDEDYLYLLSNTPDLPIINIFVINKNIQKILTLRSPEDVGVEFNEDVGDNDTKKLISSSEIYSNSSEDTIYSQ